MSSRPSSAVAGVAGVQGRAIGGRPEQDARTGAVSQLRREFQDATKRPVRAQARAGAPAGPRKVKFEDGSVEQEYIHNLQQQIYFLELECQFLRASLESGGQPGTDASGFHLAQGVGPGGKSSKLREDLDAAERANERLKEEVRGRRGAPRASACS